MHRRPVGRLAAAAVSAALVLASAPWATAADGAGTAGPQDPALEQLRQQLAESSQAMLLAAVDLHRAELALPGARQAAAQAQTLLAQAERDEAAAERRHGIAQTRLMLASQGAEQTAGLVSAERARIGRLARAAYQRGGELGDMSMLLEAGSPSDFAERLVTLQTVMSSQRSALADLETVEQTYGHQQASLEQIRDEVAAAYQQSAARLATVADLAARAKAAADQVAQLVADRRAAMAAARAAEAVDAAQQQDLRGESSQLQRLLAAEARRELGGTPAPGSTIPARPGTLAWPAIGPITSPFGIRVHPITGVRKLHTGTDIGVPCGTPIRAARDGTVLTAGWNTAYGWRTVVSHGVVDGALLTTTYNHQEELGVQTGQHVRAGEVIGYVGTTGYSTGCHLHFELIVNSDLVDPVPWLTPR